MTPASPVPSGECSIDAAYLLVLNVALLRGPDGTLYADRLWAKDLLLHRGYIRDLTYVSPVTTGVPTPDHVDLSHAGIRFVSYSAGTGRIGAYLGMLRLLFILLREVPRARIVHTGVAGYPFPAGWLAIPLARLWQRKIVVIIESAFWRIPPGARASVAGKLRARLWEAVNRACMRQVDYAAYSHDQYRQSLPAPRAGGGTVSVASWVDAAMVLDAATVMADWTARRAAGRVRVLYAARLVPEKGTRLIAETVRQLREAATEIDVHVIGQGPDRPMLEALRADAWGREHVRMIDPVPYGPAFFALLREYDAVLVPGVSDEQPRIVFDAYAQGLPAIGTRTPGLVACITDGETGRIVPTADAQALADALGDAARAPETLLRWGLAARDHVQNVTHEAMHAARCRDLNSILEPARS